MKSFLRRTSPFFLLNRRPTLSFLQTFEFFGPDQLQSPTTMSLHLSYQAGPMSFTSSPESHSLSDLPQEFEDLKMEDATASDHEESQCSPFLNLSRDILLYLFHSLPTHQSSIQLSQTCTFMHDLYTHHRMQINRSIIPREYPGKALDILNIFRPASADPDVFSLFEGFRDLQPPIRLSTKSMDGDEKPRRIRRPLAKGKDTFGKPEIKILRQQSRVIDGWVDKVYDRFQKWNEINQEDDYLGNMITRWVPKQINPGWLIEAFLYDSDEVPQGFKEQRIQEARNGMRSIIQSLIIAVSHFRAIWNVVLERVPSNPKSLRYIYFDNVLSGMDHFLGLHKGHVYDFHYLYSLSKEELLAMLVVLVLLFGDQIHRERAEAIDNASTTQLAFANTNMFEIRTSYYSKPPSLLQLAIYLELALFDGCRSCASAHFCDFVVQVKPMIHPGPNGYMYGILQDSHKSVLCTNRKIHDWDKVPIVSLVGGTDVIEGTALLIPEIAALMAELRAQMDRQMEAMAKNAEEHGVEYP